MKKLRLLTLTDSESRCLREALDTHLCHLRNDEAFASGEGHDTSDYAKEIRECERLKRAIRMAPKQTIAGA